MGPWLFVIAYWALSTVLCLVALEFYISPTAPFKYAWRVLVVFAAAALLGPLLWPYIVYKSIRYTIWIKKLGI